MTKRDWSSIHGEVKEDESMKTTVVVWVQDGTRKRGEKPLVLSLSFLIIYILMHCENKRLLNACMTENRMYVFS